MGESCLRGLDHCSTSSLKMVCMASLYKALQFQRKMIYFELILITSVNFSNSASLQSGTPLILNNSFSYSGNFPGLLAGQFSKVKSSSTIIKPVRVFRVEKAIHFFFCFIYKGDVFVKNRHKKAAASCSIQSTVNLENLVLIPMQDLLSIGNNMFCLL